MENLNKTSITLVNIEEIVLFYKSMNLGTFVCIVLFGLRSATNNIRDYTYL